MSRATRCDRCARYEDGGPECTVTIRRPRAIAANEKEVTPDLCTRCLASLEDWLALYRTPEGDA